MRAHVKTEVAFLIETSQEALVSMNVIVFLASLVPSVKLISMIASHTLVSKVKKNYLGNFKLPLGGSVTELSARRTQNLAVSLWSLAVFYQSSRVQILGPASLNY